jgi:response regulator of citrate/malate metabolism
MYFCGIIENEPLAESMLKRYLKRFPFIEIAWECSYAEEAIDLIEKKK